MRASLNTGLTGRLTGRLTARLIVRLGGLALASLLCAPVAFGVEATVSNADGVLKLSDSTPAVGQALTVSFTTTAKHNKLSPCSVQLIARSPDSGNNFMKLTPNGPYMLDTSAPLVMPFTLTQPGKYRVLAVTPGTAGGCGSLSSGTIISSNLQIDFTLPAPPPPIGQLALANTPMQVTTLSMSGPPGTCPTGYDRLTSGVDTSKGEFYCIKKWQECPAGYTQSVNDNTGVITCSPTVVPTCPSGWTGGVADGGKLVCNPVAQPVIACGDSPMKAQGYYLQYQKYQNPGWNRMGCYALQQIK
ncbi:MAG: hypothetical protein JWN73_4324 [Betaproteobacteria bacterium]|nr:hypothetical protein [Betaproteobacteria bacterium]